MAKKKKFEGDEFDFDNELDFPNFGDMDLGADFEIKDDRNPVIRAKDGFVSGMKDSMLSDEFIKKTVVDNLPKGYGEGLDFVSDATSSLKDLYNTSAQELKPVLKDIKRATSKVLPFTESVLPKFLQEKLISFSKDEEADRRQAAIDAREASIQAGLGDIFKAQEQAKANERKNDDAKANLREAVEQKRFKSSIRELDAIRLDLSRIQNYTTNVTSGFQRKSLELQYRQYFILMDSLEEQKKLSAIAENRLKAIEKNTGLPDFVKMTQGESLKEIMRNKFMDSLDEGLFGSRRNFVRNLGASVTKTVKNRIKSFASDVNAGMSGVEMAADAMQMAKESGMGGLDPAEMAGSMVGGMATDSMGKWIGKKIRPIMQKNKGVVKLGNKIGTVVNTIPQHMNEFANREDYDEESKFMQFLHHIPGMGIVKEAVRGMRNVKSDLEVDSVNTLMKPQPYNRKDSKSLSLVIPGLLARIHREINVLRTGDENAPLLSFDWDRDQFTTETAIKQKIYNRIVRKEDRARTQEDLANMVGEIDADKQLTPEQRKILGDYILRQNLDTKLINKKTLTSPEFYKGKAGQYQDVFSEMFAKYFADDDLGEKERSFVLKANDLGRGLGDPRAIIQNFVNAGYISALREMGLVDKDGNYISMKTLDDNSAGVLPEYVASPTAFAPSAKRNIRVNRTTNNFNKTTSVDNSSSMVNVSNTANTLNRSMVKLDNSRTVNADINNTLNADNRSMSMRNSYRSTQVGGGQQQSEIASSIKKVSETLQEILKAMPTMDGVIAAIDSSNVKGDIRQLIGVMQDKARNEARAAQRALRPQKTTVQTAKPKSSGRLQHTELMSAIKSASSSGELGNISSTLKEVLDRGSDKTSHLELVDAVRGNNSSAELGEIADLLKELLDLSVTKEEHQELISAVKSLDNKRELADVKSVIRSIASRFAARDKNARVNVRPQSRVNTTGRMENEELLSTIRGNNVKPEIGYILDTLHSIDDRLAAGIPSFTIPFNKDNWEKYGGKLGKAGKKVFEFGKGKFDWLKQKAKGLIDLDRSKALLDKGLEIGGKFLKNTKDTVAGITDVYIQGELVPRLTAWKLKAGMYKDQATGKVISSYKDIAGTVIDENGNVVFTADEIKNLFIKKGAVGTAVGKLTKLGKKGIDFVTGFYTDAMKRIPGVYGMAIEAATNLFQMGKKALREYIDGPVDIYVKGNNWPSVTAIGMRCGSYISQKTGNPVTKLSEIDGPIVNSSGEVVLSQDDIAKGLVDKFGKPLRSGVGKLIDKVRGIWHTGLGMVKNAGKRVMGVFGTGFAILRDLLGGAVAKDGFVFSRTSEIVDHLAAIRKLLDDRLPQRKKRVAGDSDGDGIREGSVEDLRRKKKAKEEEASNNVTSDKKGDPTKGILTLASLKGLMDKFRKKGDDDEDSDGLDVDIDLGGDGRRRGLRDRWRDWKKARAAKNAAKAAKAAKAAGKVGRYGRLGRAAGSLGRGAWGLTKGVGSLAMGAGRLAGGVLGVGNGILGTAASVAGRAALGMGGLLAPAASAVASTAMTAGGALLGGVGSVLGGIGAVLASPVVLGALAVAAVGAGAYFGYKYFTRNKLMQLNKLRYVQYGFLPEKNDYASKIWAFEDALLPTVSYGTDGVAKIDESKIKDKVAENIRDAIKDFGIDFSKQDQLANFLQWMEYRFKPVFLTHLTALKKVNSSLALADVDSKLKGEEKKKFFDLAKFTDGPYSVKFSPFPELKELPAGPDAVKNLTNTLQVEIDKEAKTPTSKNAATRAAIAASTVTDTAEEGKRKAQKAQADKSGSSAMKVAAGVGGAAAAVAATKKIQNSTFEDNRGMYYVSGTASPINQAANGRITALDAVRFKAYGLTAMEVDKVRVLRSMETGVLKQVGWDSKKVASWQGSVQTAANKFGSGFGVDGEANDDTIKWTNWFVQRFLPVYMNYLTAMMANTGKDDPVIAAQTMKPSQALNVAQAVVSTNSPVGGSVWSRPDTPWPGYSLNTDVKTTDGNIQGIKDQVKEALLTEEIAKKTGKDGKPLPGSGTGIGATLSNFWDKTRAAVADAHAAAVGLVSKEAAEDVRAFIGGTAMNRVDGGTGGAMDSVPMPKGDGSWAAMKDTITTAAKIVGVDPKLMATMAAIESGFKANVKAGTSSATGLYQFISGTWKTMLQRYGSKYGIPMNTPATDPRANALMGAEYIKENARYLSRFKSQLTDTDIYMAHFLGAGGAAKFLKADPNSIGAQAMPKEAAANKPIFYNQDGTPRTMAAIYQHMNNLLRTRGKQFGIDSGGGTEALVANPTNSATASTAAPTASAPAQAASVATAAAVPMKAQADKVDTSMKGSQGPMGAETAVSGKSKKKVSIPIDNQATGIASIDASGMGVGKGYASSARAAAVSGVAAATQQSSPVDPGVNEFAAGFTPTSTRASKANDLQLQTNLQSETMKQAFSGVETLMQQGVKELVEHTGLLKALIRSVDNMAKVSSKAAPASSAITEAALPKTRVNGAQKPQVENVPRPPVSLDKPT